MHQRHQQKNRKSKREKYNTDQRKEKLFEKDHEPWKKIHMKDSEKSTLGTKTIYWISSGQKIIRNKEWKENLSRYWNSNITK